MKKKPSLSSTTFINYLTKVVALLEEGNPPPPIVNHTGSIFPRKINKLYIVIIIT
jgi:hypothetical protein